jgi:hypothetical protein
LYKNTHAAQENQEESLSVVKNAFVLGFIS